MRTRDTGVMALAVLLTACQALPPGKAALTPGTKSAATTAPRPAASPDAAGTTPASPARVLTAPAGPSVKLSGQVALDAGYATRYGGASRLVGPDGATLVGMDGATYGGADAPSLVAGGQVISAAGGNVVVPASLIGADGATLIGLDGGTLIGADAPARAFRGSPAFALAQAGLRSEAAVPAAGMWVSVVDMRTGFTVPLGQDGARDVHTVYSDAQGRFEVYVDPAVAPHARVVARAPGRRDARLTLTVIAGAGQEELRVDEREALTTGYIRTILGLRLVDLFGIDTDQAAADADQIARTGETKNATQAMLQILGSESMRALRAALVSIGVATLSPERKQELALLMADRILAESRLDEMTLVMTAEPLHDPRASALEGTLAIPALRAHIEDVIAAADRMLAGQADPAGYLATRPWLIEANLRRPAEDRYRLASGLDVQRFMVQEYLANNDSEQGDKVASLLHDLGLPLYERDRIRIVGESFMLATLSGLVATAGETGRPTADLVAELITTTGARLAQAPPRPLAPPTGPDAPPVPTPPPAPAYAAVETVAGAPSTAGWADGPGAVARFKHPQGLVAAPTAGPPVLYLADSENHVIRKLSFDAAGGVSVATIAGRAGVPGNQNGAGPEARFATPQGLALDAQGRLYVADQFNHAIRRLSEGPDGVWTSETLAGSGKGFADGPAATAKFDLPRGLAVDAAGDVLVADTLNNRVRRIALSRGGEVETLIGTGRHGIVDGPAKDAWLAEPTDVEVAPDGSLYVVTQSESTIRHVAAPVGPEAEVRFIAGAGPDGNNQPDGFYSGSWFVYVQAIALDPQGRVVVADYNTNRIRLVTPAGWVSTIAGGGDRTVNTYQEGAGADARFARPGGVCVTRDGTIFVADTFNHVIRRIAPR